MIVTKIYYIVGVKFYAAYTGDTAIERIKYIIPANSEEEAIKTVENRTDIDKIESIKLLYEIVEGCGYDENKCWSIINGVDSDLTYQI